MASSDVRAYDIDGDGKLEYMVFAPFHGKDLYVFREESDGWQEIYHHDTELPFLHSLWAGELGGIPTFLVGHRQGDRDLYAMTWDQTEEKFVLNQLDHDCGPTNVDVYQYGDNDYIIATNREINEVALYKVNP